jgi:membrane protein YqaA with SNARE-associated domain
MAELAGLAAACFLAATLIPLPSEAALFAYIHLHPANTVLAIAVATAANTAGGMTSYAVGRLLPPREFNPRAVSWVRRYGSAATTLAFLPFIGDALCVAAGWLRAPWPAVLVFMAAGRLARYSVVAYLA